ncbi:hypothetical protein CBR_g20131 [Chara braunii]|uniref:Uncharacterized protein n=1 Tax=Chara braunii TaxID=69332 RepID=A0A388KZL2_CHABU|nr:hypothetical protein CBR_g20131 [Chara braunii]|eukprot:GBG75500.1 hypothetical protein CBR_g20131 [Chara braunii]
MMTTKWFKWLMICPSDGAADNCPDSQASGGGHERVRRRSRCGCLQCKRRRRRRSRGSDKHHGRKRQGDAECGCDGCKARESSRVSPGTEKGGEIRQGQVNEGEHRGGEDVEELRRRISLEVAAGKAERDVYREESGSGHGDPGKSPEDEGYPEGSEKWRQTGTPYGRQFALSLEELRSVKLRKVRRPSMEALAKGMKDSSELESVGTGKRHEGDACPANDVRLLSPVYGDEEEIVTSADEDVTWKYVPRARGGSSDFSVPDQSLPRGAEEERAASPMAIAEGEGVGQSIRVADGSGVYAVKSAHRVSPLALSAWEKVAVWMERGSMHGDGSVDYLSLDDEGAPSLVRSVGSTRVEVLDEGMNGAFNGDEERGVSPQPADLAFGRSECPTPGLSESGLEAWNRVLTWMNRERRLSINELFLEPANYEGKSEDGVNSASGGSMKLDPSARRDAEFADEGSEKLSGTFQMMAADEVFRLDSEREWDEADGTPARSVLRAQQALSEIEKMLRDRGTCSNESAGWLREGRDGKPLGQVEDNQRRMVREPEPGTKKGSGSSSGSSMHNRGWGMAMLKKSPKMREAERDRDAGGSTPSHRPRTLPVNDAHGQGTGEHGSYQRCTANDPTVATNLTSELFNVGEVGWAGSGSSLHGKEGAEQGQHKGRATLAQSKEDKSKETQRIASGRSEEGAWSEDGLCNEGSIRGQSLSARIEREFSSKLEARWKRGSHLLKLETLSCPPSQREKGLAGGDAHGSVDGGGEADEWFDRDEVENGLTGFEAELVKAVKAWDQRRLLDTPKRVHVPNQLESCTTGEEKVAVSTGNEESHAKHLVKLSPGRGGESEEGGAPDGQEGRAGACAAPWVWDQVEQRSFGLAWLFGMPSISCWAGWIGNVLELFVPRRVEGTANGDWSFWADGQALMRVYTSQSMMRGVLGLVSHDGTFRGFKVQRCCLNCCHLEVIRGLQCYFGLRKLCAKMWLAMASWVEHF